jgi:hypothetical protein
MPHGPTIALATAAAWLMVRAQDRPGGHRALGWCVAGILLGLTVTIRPLTGAAITLSIVLWLLLRRKYAAPQLAGLLASFGLGSALPPWRSSTTTR